MSRGTIRVRCAPAYATNFTRHISVDRENLVIRNAVVMLANVEAIGHGLMSDVTTLEQTALSGNSRRNGTQGRLGHPGLSENAAARQMFAAQNFRVVDDRLLADLHLFEPARYSPAFGHDPVEWLLDMCEQYPDQVALSAVVNARPIWKLASGEEIDAGGADYFEGDGKPESATTDLPIMRVEDLWAVDVVNEGALTRGMFSPNEAAFYADGVFEFLDEWRAQFGIPLERVPEKVHQVMERYLYARGAGMAQKKNSSVVSKSVTRKLEGGKPVGEEVESLVGVPVGATEPVEPEQEEDELDGAVADAEATSAKLDEQAEAADHPEDEVETVNAEKFQALQQRYAALEERFEKLVKLTMLNTANIKTLAGDVARIEGEPVVDEVVPRTGSKKASLFGAGIPRALAQQTPGSVSGRNPQQTPDFDTDPVGATLAAVMARQQVPG